MENKKRFIFFLALWVLIPFSVTRADVLLDKTYEESGKEVTEVSTNAGEVEVAGVIKGRILAKFKEGVSREKQKNLLDKFGFQVISQDELGILQIAILEGQNPEDAASEFLLDGENILEFAEPDAVVPSSFVPDDTDFASQWYQAKIGSTLAWDSAKGSGVTIAIADTGVDADHPDLIDNLVSGYNFYDNNTNTDDVHGHGTSVAGVAAAVGNNNLQVAGVAFESKIMPLRIADADAYSTWYAMAQAIRYAADHGAKVINISYQESTGNSTVRTAAAYMRSKGGLVVFCEGNSGTRSTYNNSPDIINVSSTGSGDVISSFSTYGADVDLAAPGENILTTEKGGLLQHLFSGTSFSSPIVAGVAALIWSAEPSLTPQQVENVLFSSAVDKGSAGWDEQYGWGRVSASAAMQTLALTIGDSIKPTAPENLAFLPLDNGVSLSWNASTDNSGTISGYEIYRDGNLVASLASTTFVDYNANDSQVHFYKLKAFDGAGNRSDFSAEIGGHASNYQPFSSTSIKFDSKQVKSGKTSKSKVKLKFSNINSATQYMISKRSDFSGASWKSIKSSTTLSLKNSGKKKYYVKFRDVYGFESQTFSKSVTYKPSTARSIKTSPSKVSRGQMVTLSGKKFSANDWVEIYLNGSMIARVKTDEKGNFTLARKAWEKSGNYTWYALNLKTGMKSKNGAYKVL